jgi:hypothetical protein
MAWWEVYTVEGSDAGEAIPHLVESNTKPKIQGDIEWVIGPYATSADATGGEDNPKKQVKEGKFNGPKPKDPVTSVANFLSDLTSRNTLQRLAEGTIGILLIVVGVAKLTEGTAVGTALKKLPLV